MKERSDMGDIKQEILNDIERRVSVFMKSAGHEYRIRCPICGDSQRNPRDAHCYIRCSDDPSEPLLYYCFKCNSHGKVGPDFLQRLNVKPNLISMIAKQKYNRIPPVNSMTVEYLTGSPIIPSLQTQYIEGRLGSGFTAEDYDRFKIVWDMNTVASHCSQQIQNRLPGNWDSISFISENMCMLATRTFEDTEPAWNKLKLANDGGKSFYTIKSVLDLFTQDEIVVNIAEGVFDILSVYRNFNDGPNSIFIATLGSDYMSALTYAIGKGFIGHNVTVKIYIDWSINEGLLRRQLRKHKWLFDKIYVYRNMLYKDVGVTMDQIRLAEYRI